MTKSKKLVRENVTPQQEKDLSFARGAATARGARRFPRSPNLLKSPSSLRGPSFRYSSRNIETVKNPPRKLKPGGALQDRRHFFRL